MSTVKIQYNNGSEIIENVTKLHFRNEGLFDSYLTVYQGRRKRKINTTNVCNFEIAGEKS